MKPTASDVLAASIDCCSNSFLDYSENDMCIRSNIFYSIVGNNLTDRTVLKVTFEIWE